MGVFRVKVQVYSLQDSDKRQDVEMIVDTGAFRTLIPRAMADALGVKQEKRQTFRMINGEPITRDLGWVGLSLEGESAYTLAILGEPGDEPVLGALTLKELTLEVDPSRRRLRPMRELLMLAVA